MIESDTPTPGARRMTINDHIEIECEGTLTPYQNDAALRHAAMHDNARWVTDHKVTPSYAAIMSDDPLHVVMGLRDRIKTMKQRIAQRREEIAHLQTEAKLDDAAMGSLVGELHAALDRLVKEAAL